MSPQAAVTDLLTQRIPPHDLSAEQGVLGAILWGQPGALERAQRRLQPDDFYLERHRQLWAAMEACAAQGRGIDHITLAAELRRQGTLDGLGGPATLATLMDTALHAVFVDDYIRLMRVAAAQRRAIAAAARVIGDSYDRGATTPAEALQRGATALAQAAELAVADLDQTEATRRPQPLGQVLADVVATFDQEETDFAPTPIAELNQRLGGGLLRAELCYLGGRPGVSKTALALQWALLAAQRGCATLVVSREMKNVALGRRVLAQQANVSATGLRKRDLLEGERVRIARAVPRLAALPVWFDDEAASIGQIRRAVHALRPRLLVVDYVQLVRAPEAAKQQRRLEVTAVSAGLKDCAMRYGCSVLALSSLRRLGPPEKGKGGKPKSRPAPTLDDLKESGDLEADADVVVLLHHPDPASPDRRLLFEKIRDGQAGDGVTLAWQAQYVRFTEVEGGPAAELLLDPDDPANEVTF